MSSDEMGNAGTREPTTDIDPPETDPEVKAAGEPTDGPGGPEGSSGAEEGLSPWSQEAYEADPEGPTTSTED